MKWFRDKWDKFMFSWGFAAGQLYGSEAYFDDKRKALVDGLLIALGDVDRSNSNAVKESSV